MSFHSLRGTRCVSFIAASILVACGDDTPSTTTDDADSAIETDGSDTMAPDTTDATHPDTDDTTDATDTTHPDADETVIPDATDTTDTDTPQPGTPTATVTIDGTSSDVTPSVRRGFVYTQSVQGSATTGLHQPTPISCEGTGDLNHGGRILNPMRVSIGGDFGSTCDPGGNGENFRIGEEQMLYGIRESCGGKTGTCSHDFSESFLFRFGSCAYDNVRFTVQYNCEALFPGPSYLIEVPTSYGLLRTEGLDGLGEMGCEQRVATFRIDGQPVTLGEGTCKVTIDERGPARLAGRIEATLALGGSDRQVVIDFASEATETRTNLIVFFQDDLCATSNVTASVRTEGSDTFDEFVTAALSCQANPQRTIEPITVSIRRPRIGETDDAGSLEARTAITQGANLRWFYNRFLPIDDSPTRTRFGAYEARICSDDSQQSCASTLPVLYFQATKPGVLSPAR